MTCMPSPYGVPPQPPAGRSETTEISPVSGSAAVATNQLHSEQPGAITWSGMAFASASQIAPVIFDDDAVVQPNVGDGHFGFSHVPSGMVRSICRYSPAFGRTDSRGRRLGRKGEAYAWWVRARYPDGRVHVHALDRDEVERHRSFSKQPNGDMWTKSYDAAALKTVVLDMRRWLPMSPQLAAAAAAEGSVVDVRDLDPDQPELPPGDSDSVEPEDGEA